MKFEVNDFNAKYLMFGAASYAEYCEAAAEELAEELELLEEGSAEYMLLVEAIENMRRAQADSLRIAEGVKAGEMLERDLVEVIIDHVAEEIENIKEEL